MAIYTDILKTIQIGKSEYNELLDSLYHDFLLGEAIPNFEEIELDDMKLVLDLLLAKREITKNALYKNKLKTREEMATAVAFLSKVSCFKEIYELNSGKTSLAEIQKAAKTLAPKMQSAFNS